MSYHRNPQPPIRDHRSRPQGRPQRQYRKSSAPRVRELDRSNLIERATPRYATSQVEVKATGPEGIVGSVRIYQHGRLIGRGEITHKSQHRDQKTGRVVVRGHLSMEARKYVV